MSEPNPTSVRTRLNVAHVLEHLPPSVMGGPIYEPDYSAIAAAVVDALPTPPIGQLEDDDHALLCGQVAMSLCIDLMRPGPMKTEHVALVDDGAGNHTDAVRITRPSGTYLVLIKKET